MCTQYIRQPQKVERRLRSYVAKATSQYFVFLQLRSNDKDLRLEYEDNFIKKYKTKIIYSDRIAKKL